MSNSHTPSTTACPSSEQTIRSHYDQVIYPSSAYHTCHPDRLATQAILHGVAPAPVDECRVLELGCADGGNLIPMALSLPSSEFVGIDLSPRQIAVGLNQIEALDLENIRLICQSIADIGPELGRFDYIIAHGVFSWVPREVQDRILEICRDHLTPHGVAYVSYNAYPGAHHLQMLREMLLYHTRGMEDIEQRGRRALELLRFLAARKSGDDPIAFFLNLCRDKMEEVPDPLSFVVHEYLANYNVPIYFHEFIQRAEKAGLQYFADADPTLTSIDPLPREIVAVLDEFSRDHIEREQYLDFLYGASFRHSLLCHGDVVLKPEAGGERVHRLYAAAPLQELTTEEAQAPGHTFRTWTGRTFSFEYGPTVDLLRRLLKRWPEQISCAELIRSGSDDTRAEACAELLCSLFRSGCIELHSIPFDCMAVAGERPTAGLLARQQAKRGLFVTSQLHRAVKMEDEVGRFLLIRLDGSRDRQALAALLEQAVRDGRLSISYKDVPVLEHPEADQVLLDLVERHLQKMAEVALLVDCVSDNWERLNRALTLHGDGLFAKAAEHYTEALEKYPSRVDLIYLAGLTSAYNKPPDEVVAFFHRFVERYGPRMVRSPDPGAAGQDTEPERIAGHCERNIRHDPKNVAARVRWGCFLERQGRYQEAIEFYQQALDLRPRLAFLWVMVARSLLGMQRTEEAIQALNRCLEPMLPLEEVLAGLGALFLWTDQPQQAVFYLERASEKIPDDPILLNNLADALYANGELLEALQCYDRVIGLDAASADTWYATGKILAAVGEYAQSLGAYRHSLEMVFSNPEVHYNLGVALYRLGDVDTALHHLETAADQGMVEARLGIATAIPGSPKSDLERIRFERQRFAEQVTGEQDPLPAFEVTVQERERDRPLQIGYISAFFHKPNYMKPVWGLLNHHDRRRFRIHLFSDTPQEHIDSGYRAHTEDGFHFTAGLSNRELADCIRQQQIDILVDLNGFSAVERLPLFVHRTAPLTVAWFNMYATSGFPVFDVLISDEHVVRPGEETFYIERVVPLPVSYLTFEVHYPVPPVAPPPCLRNGYLTFGCLGSQYKITPPVLESWATILDHAPEVRLLIANPILKSKVTREEYIYPHFAKNGIQRERLTLSGPEDHFKFLKKYDEIDVALDTFPYNGGTTTMEAIWQGVPVLTIDGDRWASRTSASLLRNCHLADFVARGAKDYVTRAVDLAEDGDTPEMLRGLRRDMRKRLQASSVCDTAALARHMEEIYRRLWEEKMGGEVT